MIAWVSFPETATPPADAVGEVYDDGDAIHVRPHILAQLERYARDLARVPEDSAELAEDVIDRLFPDRSWPEAGGCELVLHLARVIDRLRAHLGVTAPPRIPAHPRMRYSEHPRNGAVG